MNVTINSIVGEWIRGSPFDLDGRATIYYPLDLPGENYLYFHGTDVTKINEDYPNDLFKKFTKLKKYESDTVSICGIPDHEPEKCPLPGEVIKIFRISSEESVGSNIEKLFAAHVLEDYFRGYMNLYFKQQDSLRNGGDFERDFDFDELLRERGKFDPNFDFDRFLKEL